MLIEGKKSLMLLKVEYFQEGKQGKGLTSMLDCVATTFTVADTKLYVPVVTLSTQDNAKLF